MPITVHEREAITPMIASMGRIGTGACVTTTPGVRTGRRMAMVRISKSSQIALKMPGKNITAVPRTPKSEKSTAPMIGPSATPSVPPVT